MMQKDPGDGLGRPSMLPFDQGTPLSFIKEFIKAMRAAAIVIALTAVACTGTAAAPPAEKPAAKATGAAPAPAPVDPSAAAVTGTVLETMNAGQYTYVRLKTAEGEIWAAVMQQELKTGAEITIGDSMWMQNFESKTLKRTFDNILFGAIVGPGQTGAAAAGGAMPPGHPPAGGTASAAVAVAGDAPITDVKVDKATGKDARTIAEVWASAPSLKGTEVVIRGRVVKWNPEIMGKNWLHLQDGTGSAEKKTHDITVTTMDVVAKGDIVTIRGKVTADKDFGAGYAYAVMIEGAKVVK